jgi:putative transposase
MEWQPTRWTPAQLEERRLAAARLLRAGRLTQAEIARRVGVHRAAVTKWKHRMERDGPRGLRRRASPGRPSHLRPDQWAELLRLLRGSAAAAGFETERWTLRRIAAVVERAFGVRYHPRWLGPALRARGWSPQVPIARARERDDALVEAWLKRDWPRVKKMLAAPGGPSSSSTRPATASWRASAPPGRRRATRRSCAG